MYKLRETLAIDGKNLGDCGARCCDDVLIRDKKSVSADNAAPVEIFKS